ncbi:MAG: M23 family metallopeptidase [Christensenellaceae bacterium]|nr:M23 family metallopeptidase [Christensenellaceae bacterium]
MPEIKQGETRTGSFHTREKRLTEQQAVIEWQELPKRKTGEHLMRNLATASALVLCAVALRQGALPGTSSTVDAVMTAVTDNTLLDDTLGRLSFVSSLFPEATLVFGEQTYPELAMPVSGGTVVHAWSEAEPYTTWRSDARTVTSSMDGEIIGVYHGEGEELLVQVMAEDGLACLYGNLAEVRVAMGDAVQTGDVLGTVMTGADCVMELRRDGISIDPTTMLP